MDGVGVSYSWADANLGNVDGVGELTVGQRYIMNFPDLARR